MKTLVIIRHGKSTWDYSSIIDLDRPLKESGIHNSLLITGKLKELNIYPQRILTSHAVRALHTSLIFARELTFPFNQIEIEPVLYHDNEDEIIDYLKLTENHINTIFIFGHNPTFTFLANIFLKNKIDNLPTSGTVIIEFNCGAWNEISIKTKHNERILVPKSLNSD